METVRLISNHPKVRERAEMLGGSLEFLRPPDGGTLVRLRVPIEGKDAHGE